MTESCEPEVVLPCEGNCESILQDLYINLCNLIVECRIPGINERGYGDGCHCPPLMGPNTHKCDHSKLECQKHQRLIHHLLRAIKRDVFEIEVLMLPDCCTETKLTERIQNKEYLLLERWSLNCTTCKGQPSIEVSQLLRAVRSFLHFSQISAWLSSTLGKSPTNIYYRVKPYGDGSAISFEREPEVHSFPVCKISEDLYGCVTVKYPTRTQYVPIIPCSKHPPLRGYSFRTIDETNLCPAIPLNPQLVRQLQITCDTSQSTPITKTFVPDPATLLLTPVSLLKTLSSKVSDGNMSNRILKHSNCQTDIINSTDITLDLSKTKNIDVISKSQTAFVVCNYTETCSKVQSQESVCFRKRQLAMHLHKAGLKLRKLNSDLSAPPEHEVISDSLQSSSNVHSLTTGKVSSREECCDVAFQVPNSLSVTASKGTQLENFSSPSPSKRGMTCNNHTPRNHLKHLRKRKTVSKRKHVDVNADQTFTLPHKKVRCDTHDSSQLFNNALSSESNQKIVSILKNNASHVETEIPALVSPVSNSQFEDYSSETYIDHCVNHLNRAPDIKNSFLKDNNLSNFTTVISREGKRFRQCNTFNSQNHVKKRKRASHHTFYNIINQEIERNSSVCNSFQRNLSDETFCVSEFDSKERCNTANECNYTLNKNSHLPCSLKSVSKKGESMMPNLCLDLSESENECSEIKFSYLSNILKNSCTIPEENSSSGSILMPESSELTCKLQEPSLSCCKMNLSAKRILPSENRVSLDTNVKSEYVYFHNKAQKTNLERDLVKAMIQKSFTKSSNISQEKTKNDHSSLYVNSSFESLDCSSVMDFDHSNNEEERNRDENCKISRNRGFGSTQKKGETNSKIALKPRIIKQLRTKVSKVRNKSPNILENNYRTIKPHSSHKCKLRKMCNFKSAIWDHSKSKKIHVSTPPETSGRLQYALPKTANVPISENSNAIASLEHSNEMSDGQSRHIQNSDDKNNTKFGTSFKHVTNSRQNDKPSTFALYPSTTNAYRTLLCQATNENLECFPKHVTKFPKARKLLINFEESILKGRLPTVNNVKGFYAEIGASGSFCPNHLTLPADVNFYDLGNSSQGAAPYVAHINLGVVEYYLPKKGAVQVTLFNPSETVVKMFVLNYDLSNMPPLCHTFIRQKIFYLPVGSKEENLQKSQKWLRFIIHLRFASTKTGKIYLHKDFKIVVLNKSNDDAASEFSQEPRELRSFLSVPMNPTFSSI